YGPFATSASRSRLRLPRTTRLALRASLAGSVGFAEIEHGVDETHHVAPGYSADLLMRWGDPVVPDAPAFDPNRQSADAQRGQFGYNNDFIGYIPLPLGADNSEHGLLCINHEYTSREVMFPGLGKNNDPKDKHKGITREIVAIEMACHGGSIIEIEKHNGKWRVVPDSKYARRITALDTPIAVSGPAAGHPRLRTSADPTGKRVIGTLGNCAGGITPWGTYLMTEENVHGYFSGDWEHHPRRTPADHDDGKSNPGGESIPMEGHPEKANYTRYGVPGGSYAWGRFHRRFDINAEPNEANRFGWIVEVDPLDPASTPVKRTALGRFRHEGTESIVNGDGRLVLYSGDDQPFEYLYRFVSAGRVAPDNRAANRDLLDQGALFVARFHPEGTLTWALDLRRERIDPGKRVPRPGGRADRGPARGRCAPGYAHGPYGGRGAQSSQRPCLRDAQQEFQTQAGSGRSGEPAGG
ncbi:MAG: Putative phosphatase, partial [Olavius algarvensis Gamma 1 endosymbiont]